MTDESKYTVRTFPMLDTGLGREAGWANDAELLAAAEEQRAELRELLTGEAWERLERAEQEVTDRFLFGEGR